MKGIKQKHVIFVFLGTIIGFGSLGVASFIDGSTGTGFNTWFLPSYDPAVDTQDVTEIRVYNATTNNYSDGEYVFNNETKEFFFQHAAGNEIKAIDFYTNRTFTEMFAAGGNYIDVWLKGDVAFNITTFRVVEGGSVLLTNSTELEFDDTVNGTTVRFALTDANLASWAASYPDADDFIIIALVMDVGNEPVTTFAKFTFLSDNGTTLSSLAWNIAYSLGTVFLWLAIFFIIKDNHFPNVKFKI